MLLCRFQNFCYLFCTSSFVMHENTCMGVYLLSAANICVCIQVKSEVGVAKATRIFYFMQHSKHPDPCCITPGL